MTMKGKIEMEGNDANFAVVKKSYFILIFVMLLFTIFITIGIYAYAATKVKDNLDDHEKRLAKVEAVLIERTQFESEIIINLKMLMEKNGLRYQTVK